MSAFWIIDLNTNGELPNSKTAIGPFPSQKAAEKWIADDAKDTYENSSPDLREGPDEEWGDDYAIAQEHRRVRPVPSAKITVKLKEVE